MGRARGRVLVFAVHGAGAISWFGLAAGSLVGYSSSVRGAFLLCIAASFSIRVAERLEPRRLHRIGAAGAFAGLVVLSVIDVRRSHPISGFSAIEDVALFAAWGFVVVGMVVTWRGRS